MEQDDLDYQLIQILQKDGREIAVNIAKKLGIVEGTIRKRDSINPKRIKN